MICFYQLCSVFTLPQQYCVCIIRTAIVAVFQVPVQKLREALLSGDEDLPLDLDFLSALPASQVWWEWFHDLFLFLWSFIQRVSRVRDISTQPLPTPPPSFTMSRDCHYDSDEHCDRWCLYYDCHYDWLMSTVICDVYIMIVIMIGWWVLWYVMSILWLSLWLADECCDMWCLYYDCHCPHDWQVSTVLMFIFWLSLWLSPWLTAECCDMFILWLSLWLALMTDRWALAFDMMSCDCHYDWQMSTVIWCPYYDCHCDAHDWQVSTVIWCP